MDIVCGYICENYGYVYILLECGFVGVNGYVNDCDFYYFVVVYEDVEGDFELVVKFNGNMFCCDIGYFLLDVVVWIGNSVLYKYDFVCFNVMNIVSYDYLDFLIFIVLMLLLGIEGVVNIDFVIFFFCWMVVENIFCLFYYYCNIMSEFMGFIEGVYDVKEYGFVFGGLSLYNCMLLYGLEVDVFEKVLNVEFKL